MRYLIFLLLACTCAMATAQTVYRSVDANGVVTYSSTPVQGAAESEPLRLPPGPTEEQQAAARAKLEKTKQISAEMAAEREARQAMREETEEDDRLAPLGGRSTTIGARTTREEAAEGASSKLEELKESVEHTKESAREGLADRREERGRLPREPVHIQPVPGPGDGAERPGPVRIQPVPSVGAPGGGAPSGPAGGGRRGRSGG
jgi:hypothetical protein